MTGLTSTHAQELLKKYGKNELKVVNKNPWWKMLFSQFTDILVIILIIAACISGFHGELVDTLVIVVIILLNGLIGFFQEFRTEKTLAALQKMISPEVRVIRDAEEKRIPVSDIVPGDIVILSEGDKISADGNIIEANALKVEEAALTGESFPIEKKLGEEIFMGTSLVKGSGKFEVTKTGQETRFGEIAKLAVETEKGLSPLQKELKQIGKFVAKVTLGLCIIIFVIAYQRNGEFFSNLMYAVSIAIAAVPEGLPTTITIALALGASVLAGKKVVIKKLSSVETLGAVTTICSDKTGTLTKNEMTARKIYLSTGEKYDVSGAGYDPRLGKINTDTIHPTLEKLIEIAFKCNESTLKNSEGKWVMLGDPTEGALATLAEKVEQGILLTDKKLDTIYPFDSERKLMSVISESELLVKGSPDHLLEKATRILTQEGVRDINAQDLENIKTQYQEMASGALRVLAFAYRDIEGHPEKDIDAEQALIFVGLVGMIDPPREEAKKAVADCKKAGIRIIVITGDYGVTAAAIGKELGIIDQASQENVFVGADVEKMTDEQLKEILAKKQSLIFSRSLPKDKMRIITLLQELGEVVAMTGDGVNDSPALKKADIGVAMGITGTEVSKESATMILLDDSFASIVVAVEEGRRIYQNLKKFIWYMFSSNIGELITVTASIVFFIPQALTAILILCINLGTDILPAIAMGVGPSDRNNMAIPPRDPKERILKKSFVLSFVLSGITLGFCVVLLFIFTLVRDGWMGGVSGDWQHAVTVAFAGLVIIQMVNTFSAIAPDESIFKTNYLKNPFHLIAVAISVVFVLCIVYIPFLNQVLKTSPLSMIDWLYILGFSIIPMSLMELRKFLRKRFTKSASLP